MIDDVETPSKEHWRWPDAVRSGLALSERLRPSLAYAIALGATAATLLVVPRLPHTEAETPIIALMIPVVLAGYLGGLGPGLAATAAAALGTVPLVLPAAHTRHVVPPAHLLKWTSLIVAGALVSGLNETLRRYWRRLEASRGRQPEAAGSVGDGVIMTDVQGRVTFLNIGAERLTGWTRREAAGKELSVVFNIVDSESRRPRPCRASTVLRSDSVESLGEHNVLLTRDGREIPIDGSCAPIEQAGGTLVGVAIVFRDSSESRKTAEALRERSALRERLAKVEATSPGVLYAFRMRPDGTSCIPFASPGVEEIYGLRLEDVAEDASSALALTHPDDIERFRASVTESARTLSPWRCEYRIVNPKRGVVWIEGRSTPEREPDGGILWHGFLNDVTERRRTQDALRESEERYRSLFDNMREGLAYCEMIFEHGRPVDFVYLDVNRAFEALTQLGDVLGKRVTEVIPGIRTANPELFEIYGRVATTGAPETFETYVEALGIWFHISVYSPHAGRFVALFDNVTERKREEQELRDSEKRYRVLVESAPEAITVLDVATQRFVEVNRNAERLFGMDREALLSISPIKLCPRNQPDGRPSLETAVGLIERTLDGDRPVVDWVCKNSSGEEIPCEIWLTRIPSSRPLIRGTVIDVRSRMKLEAQLRQSQKMEAVGRLAGGVAHDFNNLLGVITGYAELAARQLDAGHPARPRVEQVMKAADRAAALTRQLLAFSRRQMLQPKPVDLGLLLSDVERMLQRLLGEDIDLVVRSSEGLGTARVDPGQIEQVVVNLAVNARDAMPGGGTLTIESSNVELDEQVAAAHGPVAAGPYVVIAVSDTGHGMDPETQARLFEPFFTTKPAGQGTGLGLATAYGIVQQSGGSITFYSEVGRGTTFKIYLPRVAEAAAPVAEESPGGSPGGRETILLVEDQDALRDVLVEGLESLGYTVLAAPGAEGALAIASGHSEGIDLLITDVVMPGTGGRALATRLAAERPGLKVLYMSGYTADVLGRQGILDEGLDMIEKPFTADALARKAREVLGRSEPRPKPPAPSKN